MVGAEVEPVDFGPRVVARRVVVDAPADVLFALVADPSQHQELDGSGTVGQALGGPRQVGVGDRFSVSMRMFGAPYRVTSTVTAVEEGRLVQWRHPFGHSWRWQFVETELGRTQVTESFDYSASKIAPLLALARFPQRDDAGITATLTLLRDRFAGD